MYRGRKGGTCTCMFVEKEKEDNHLLERKNTCTYIRFLGRGLLEARDIFLSINIYNPSYLYINIS